MPSRVIVRIELTPSAKEHINTMCEKSGMTQVAMLSRLVEWFGGQDDKIRAAVLGHYPVELQSDIAKMILKKMS